MGRSPQQQPHDHHHSLMTTTIQPHDTINAIAARLFPGGDVRRFREILELNPDLDILSDLPEGIELNIPGIEQLENYAQPVLTRIASSLGGAQGFLNQAETTLQRISGNLPSELQGYSRAALELVGEANNVLNEVETVVEGASDRLRDYGGQGTNLVSWLLSGKV